MFVWNKTFDNMDKFHDTDAAGCMIDTISFLVMVHAEDIWMNPHHILQRHLKADNLQIVFV